MRLKLRIALAALVTCGAMATAAFAADCEGGTCRLRSKPPAASCDSAGCASTVGSTHYYSGHRRGRITWRITHPFGGRFRRR